MQHETEKNTQLCKSVSGTDIGTCYTSHKQQRYHNSPPLSEEAANITGMPTNHSELGSSDVSSYVTSFYIYISGLQPAGKVSSGVTSMMVSVAAH